MGFLRRLCPCINPKPSSPPPLPRSPPLVIKREPRATPRALPSSRTTPVPTSSPRHPRRVRRHRRAHLARHTPATSDYHALPSNSFQGPALPSGPIPSSTRFIPSQDHRVPVPSPLVSPQSRPTIRRRTSEAHIQTYQPGSFGPPIVATGPPLQEQWINVGKKKFVYSNADVIWRSNERRVHWEGAQASSRDNRGEIFNRRYPAYSSRQNSRNSQDSPRLPPTPLLRPVTLPDTDTNVFMSQTPYLSPNQARIHPALRIASSYEPSLCIHWDILHPPRTSTIHDHQASLNTARLDFNSSAAIPSLYRIHITIETPELKVWMQQWGAIHVTSSVNTYVTLGDVLRAIYEYFHTPLTQEDLTAISPGPWRGILEQARRKRSRSEQVISGSVREREFVRVDLLNGNSLFAGLRWNEESGRSYCWELILSGHTS
ncbi:hypothetical protein F5890DRAFT_1537439 [Lentinula detonsa]|uniref:DUF6699 domain-containing protein n=1 Tax=Lentinula detonsa TaxID=2804962 RepID=A0AA38PT37_9AGAR|nr:hypothetical protein F5890DRAFT_1537439 [Lentinula detonsa]